LGKKKRGNERIVAVFLFSEMASRKTQLKVDRELLVQAVLSNCQIAVLLRGHWQFEMSPFVTVSLPINHFLID
jgi:hypothetical protein